MALFDALNMDGAAGNGNIIDVNAIGLGEVDRIDASSLPGVGVGTQIVGLNPGQTLVFDGIGTEYNGIKVEGNGANIVVADGVDMRDFTIAATTLGLTVEEQGNIIGLYAQSANVIALQINGRVSGADFGEASFTGSSVIAGTLADSSLRDANVADMRVTGFLDNVDLTGLTGTLEFGRGAGLSGLFTARDGQRTDFISSDQILMNGLHVTAPSTGLGISLSEAGAAYQAERQANMAAPTHQNVGGLAADVLNGLRNISGGIESNPLAGETSAPGVIDAAAQAAANAAKELANANARPHE